VCALLHFCPNSVAFTPVRGRQTLSGSLLRVPASTLLARHPSPDAARRALFHLSSSKADKVDRVAFGDVVHLYYTGIRKSQGLGAFTVIERARHPKVALFGENVEGTALYRVLDPTFIREIDKDGAYQPDPRLGQFTGWIVETCGKARPYDPKAFPGQSTLVAFQ